MNESLPVSGTDAGPHERFLEAVKAAKNETSVRELFVILAATGFSDRDFAHTLALGAEHSVAFSRHGLVRRGRVDSFVDNVLVEFKASLTVEDHHRAARNQLSAYVAGAWAEDKSYRRPYLAVATDGRNWRVYSARPDDLSKSPMAADPDNVKTTLIDQWPRGNVDQAGASLKWFLNRTFFRSQLLRPTPENFARDFGLDSAAFLTVTDQLQRKASELADNPQMRLYEAAWWSDLQVAYGAVDGSQSLFVRHTYLSLLARLLVWATIEKRAANSDDLRQVFDRSYFISKRIGNLVEDDYFAWHSMTARTELTPAWTALVAQLATYRLDEIREDILKPLYEELVDPETRHDLGEYYTPDWLASAIVDRLLGGWDPAIRGIPRILDPACGSGSFVRASIHAIRQRQDVAVSPEVRLREILTSVHGMDVHPLATTVAKATYLLAVADLMPGAREIVHLPVFLCNSLSGERAVRTMSLMGDLINLSVGRGEAERHFPVPMEFIEDGRAYDHAIGEIVDISRSTGASRTPAKYTDPAVRSRLADRLVNFPQADVLLNSLADLCVYLTELVKRKEDTIYGFLLRNRYKSVLLRDHFDLIVGNPPWLTVADISPGEYRDLVLRRNNDLKIAPRTAGDQAHTEIATIFLAQVMSQFLRARDDASGHARLGFVLPRSVFTSSQHSRFREGTYSARFNIVELWDLDAVQPLFNVPSCVIFADSEIARPTQPKDGFIYAGRLPLRDPSVDTAQRRLTKTAVNFDLRHLGRRSAWAVVHPEPDEADEETGASSAAAARLARLVAAQGFKPRHYTARFRQGAILYPQTLIIAEQVGPIKAITRGPVTMRTSDSAARDAKLLKDLRWQRIVDAETLVYTAAAEHILPYCVRRPLWTAVLPVITSPGDAEFRPVDADALRAHGLVNSADWLEVANGYWTRVRKESERLELWQRLDHLGHLSAQSRQGRWVIIYAASGGRIVAGVIDTLELGRPFVARDKTYWCSVDDEREAHFLVGFLNSEVADVMLGDFVTRGLFGKRDIHKRVLDLPWPRFNSASRLHLRLAELSAISSSVVSEAAPSLNMAVGRARTEARFLPHLDVLGEIEDLVGAIGAEAI